jgi:hypothetical protein
MPGEHLAGLEAHSWRAALQSQVDALGKTCGWAELQAQLGLPPRTGEETGWLEAHLEAPLTPTGHQAASQPQQNGPRDHLGIDPQPRLDPETERGASTGEGHDWYQACEQGYVSVERKLSPAEGLYPEYRGVAAKTSVEA